MLKKRELTNQFNVKANVRESWKEVFCFISHITPTTATHQSLRGPYLTKEMICHTMANVKVPLFSSSSVSTLRCPIKPFLYISTYLYLWAYPKILLLYFWPSMMREIKSSSSKEESISPLSELLLELVPVFLSHI